MGRQGNLEDLKSTDAVVALDPFDIEPAEGVRRGAVAESHIARRELDLAGDDYPDSLALANFVAQDALDRRTPIVELDEARPSRHELYPKVGRGGPHAKTSHDAKLPAHTVDEVNTQQLAYIRPGPFRVAIGPDVQAALTEIEGLPMSRQLGSPAIHHGYTVFQATCHFDLRVL